MIPIAPISTSMVPTDLFRNINPFLLKCLRRLETSSVRKNHHASAPIPIAPKAKLNPYRPCSIGLNWNLAKRVMKTSRIATLESVNKNEVKKSLM